MKLRGLVTASIALLLVVIQIQQVSAKDSAIELDGEAKEFVTIIDDNEGFMNMQPGEERTASIVINNNSSEEIDFTVSGEIIDNIADKGDMSALYEVAFYKDNEANPYFKGVISNSNKDLNNSLQLIKEEYNFATLKANENTKLKIVITLDGESVGNEYMNKQGVLRLYINAQKLDEGEVQTNDTAATAFYIIVGVAALIIIIGTLFICLRKKRITNKQI